MKCLKLKNTINVNSSMIKYYELFKRIQDQAHQMNPMNCSQSAQACLPKRAMKIKTMISLVQSVGSSMMLSPMRRTTPTSLKQFEANKKAIPAALTASPRTGSAFWLRLQASKMFLAFSTNLRSSALATKSWELTLSFATCSLICGSMRDIELVAHQSFLMRSFNCSTGVAIETTKSAAKITKSVLDISPKLKYELQSTQLHGYLNKQYFNAQLNIALLNELINAKWYFLFKLAKICIKQVNKQNLKVLSKYWTSTKMCDLPLIFECIQITSIKFYEIIKINYFYVLIFALSYLIEAKFQRVIVQRTVEVLYSININEQLSSLITFHLLIHCKIFQRHQNLT